MSNLKTEPSISESSSILKFWVGLVIVGVVIYSDILYIGLIARYFPAGILSVACYIGAISTALSVLILTTGKSKWFRPGAQMHAAWIFTGIEVSILILNDIMAGHPAMLHDQFLTIYSGILTAVPVVSLVGWILILYLDPGQRVRHFLMIMQDEREISEIRFLQAQHKAEMKARHQALELMEEQLTEHLGSTQSAERLSLGAGKLKDEILEKLTGKISVKTIDASPAPAEPLPRAEIEKQETIEQPIYWEEGRSPTKKKRAGESPAGRAE